LKKFTNRIKKQLLAIFLFCIIIIFISFICVKKNRNLYNILLITIDTWKYDRLSFNNKNFVKTPTLDDIAQKGVFFKRCFAHNPVTLPSHANILLGTTPLWHGIHDNSGFILDNNFTTIAEYLKKYNYDTGAFIGAFPLDSRFGLDQGFDKYDDNYSYKTRFSFVYPERKAETVISSSLKWLKSRKNKWFSWIHLFDPHQPYEPPETFYSKYKNDLYSGEVAYTDSQIAKIINYLSSKKLLKNTLIIITGDHGESLGEHGEKTHGYFAYNSTIHIPLIIYYPEIPRKIISTNVSHSDIFPTICDILNIKIPDFVQGKSLKPLIEKNENRKNNIYFESLSTYYNRGWSPLRGYISGNFKYINQPVQELYLLNDDFNEKNNAFPQQGSPSYKKNLNSLIDKYSNSKLNSRKRIDKQTEKKLKSLGYLVGKADKKQNFSYEDDLKTLLPVHKKFREAGLYYSNGKTDKAIKTYKQIIDEKKGMVHAYINLSIIYKETGQLSNSLKILKKGLKYHSKNSNLLSLMGITLVELGKYDKAIYRLKKSININSSDAEVFNYIGIAYWKTGEFKKAIDAYNNALKIDNNYAMVYSNLGSLYLDAYMNQKAEKYFRTAIKLDPGLANAYNGLAGIYIKQKNYKKAEFYLNKCISLNPDSYLAYFNLYILYSEKTNQVKKAKKIYRKIKENFYKTLPYQEKQEIESIMKNLKKRH